MEDDERNRFLDAGAKRVRALALDELGRVGPLGQRDDPELERGLAPLGQPRRPQHRLLAGAIGVEAQVQHADDALELADLLLGQRRAHDPHRVLHPRLMEGEDIRITLDEDHPAGAGRRLAGQVDAEQLAALVVELAVRGVQVLRRLVLAHRPRAESEDAAAAIRRRKHDPLPEPVVHLAARGVRTLHQPGVDQLVLAEPGGPGCPEHPVPRARRVSDPELPQRLGGQAAAE